MTSLQLFDIWAPTDSKWSRWTKPTLFAERTVPSVQFLENLEAWRGLDVSWAPSVSENCCVIVDLPGAESVATGLALALRGYRPVPLYNGAFGMSAIVEAGDIIALLQRGAEHLQRMNIPPEAPPVFLLDANRNGGSKLVAPGRFDNRWVVFPQDFPSANFLLGHGLRRALVVQKRLEAANDLAHVLLRWKQAKLEIDCVDPSQSFKPMPLRIRRPGSFGSLWYRALVVMGLRRNSAGGFGSVVPEAHASSGYG